MGFSKRWAYIMIMIMAALIILSCSTGINTGESKYFISAVMFGIIAGIWAGVLAQQDYEEYEGDADYEDEI